MQLGRFGVWTTFRAIGEDRAGEAAALVEQLGYGTFWLGGSPRLPSVRPLLAASRRLTIATGIVNVWQYEPALLADEHAQLTREFPDRLLLGIGIGHREATSEYLAPLAKMTSFIDGLDAAASPVSREQRCIAALEPKMLDLSAQRTLGTHTYFSPLQHTKTARERIGGQALIAVELACVLDSDPQRARATARRYAHLYLGLSNYVDNLLRLGFSEQDVANDGSDRLIDAVIPQGSAEQIAAVARAHLQAGADHVCLQPLGVQGVPQREWTALASALLA